MQFHPKSFSLPSQLFNGFCCKNKNNVNQKTWTEHVPGQRKIISLFHKVTTHWFSMYLHGLRQVAGTCEKVTSQHTRSKTGHHQYMWKSYNAHSMYLQDPRQVASTCDIVTTHTQDPRQVASTCDIVTTHTQDPREVASTCDKVTTRTACNYKTGDRSPVQVTKLRHTQHVRTYKTGDRSPVQVTKLQHTQHVPTRPETDHQNMWLSYHTHM